MFIVEGHQAEASFREPAEVDAVVQRLALVGYNAVLRSMLHAACSVAGVPMNAVALEALMRGRSAFSRDAAPTVSGDLLFKDPYAYILQPIGTRLHAWEVRPHPVPSALAAFCHAVESAARATMDGRRLRGMDFAWKSIKERPSRRFQVRGRFYQEAKLDTKPAEYTPEEARAAATIVSQRHRSFLLRLAQVGKARSIDAGTDGESTLCPQLLEMGLVRREYLVLCRQDSHTICAIQEKTEIESGSGSTFRCTICGRAFRDELIQEIYALTEFGKRLLAGSRWMTIWTTELLVSAGIARDQIAWNALAGEDELDIMTDAVGPRAFFELKDREFGLGDAYPFAYRVTRYGGAFGVVISMDKVADEAKRFFGEQRPGMGARVETLEGQQGIETGMASVVDRISRTGVNQLLLELEESLGFNAVPVVQAWMTRIANAGATSNQPPQPTGLVAEAGPAAERRPLA
jgi:hypothetical protein